MNTLSLNLDTNYVLNVDELVKLETIQSLWSGYGTIERVAEGGGSNATAILKHIRLGEMRGIDGAISHRRKHTSYLVEIAWYRQYSHRCDGSCRVPRYWASSISESELVILLEDLDAAGFPLRREHLSRDDMDACLYWLANFHATFMNTPPDGLWPIGTYWHLTTRAEELRVMPKGRLKKKAHKLDEKLNAARFQTLVHGDAKPENFCFSKDGWVAAVDFQYVGRGCGMKDVAYFLWGMSPKRADEMVSLYFEHLGAAMKPRHPEVDFDALENEWRGLYPAACEDFERFLKGWFALR